MNRNNAEWNAEITPCVFEHEVYNDGLYLVEQASIQINSFDKLRFQRLSVICFASSFESFTNRCIVHKLKSRKDISKEEKRVLGFLTKKVTYGPPLEIRNVDNKMRFIEKIFDLEAEKLKNEEFIRFQRVIDLRNDIVHYSSGNFSNVYKQEIEEVSAAGAELLRRLIVTFCASLSISAPSYYQAENYQVIPD